MNKHEYKSYDEYIEVQRAAFDLKKETHQWAKEEDIELLSKYIGAVSTGMCHGVRSGLEMDWFEKHIPGVKMFGSEIGDTEDPRIIIRDFNLYHECLERRFDFIYSNSFDHAYAINTFFEWVLQLKKGGLLFIEHTARDEKSNKTDCLGMKISDYISLSEIVYDVALENIIQLDATDRQKYKLVFVYREVR